MRVCDVDFAVGRGSCRSFPFVRTVSARDEAYINAAKCGSSSFRESRGVDAGTECRTLIAAFYVRGLDVIETISEWM